MKQRWGRLKQWLLTHIWHRIRIPLGEAQYYIEPELELARRLNVRDPELAAALLDEAQERDRSHHDTANSLQGRAMTLQSAVAIATTLTLTAGGLLLDRTKIASQSWRLSFATVLLAAVVAFIGSGVQALRSSSNTFPWSYPGSNDIFDRARADLAWARASRTATYLKCAGLNARIVQVKGGYLNAAVRWFKIALGLLAVLAVLFVAYTAWGPTASSNPAPQPASSRPHRPPDCRYHYLPSFSFGCRQRR